MERFKQIYKKKMKILGRLTGWGLGITMVLGSIYPFMMWLEHDINVAKPRMNEYLSSRLK